MPLRDRLYAKIAVSNSDDCWLWIGTLSQDGYGSIASDGTMRKAHRVIWELERGPIPEGMEILHACDNPTCVNPNHLSVGTRLDNVLDAKSKGRIAIGSRNARSKLSADDVLRIRSMCAAGLSHRTVSKEFGVSHRAIGNVMTRTTWSHI